MNSIVSMLRSSDLDEVHEGILQAQAEPSILTVTINSLSTFFVTNARSELGMDGSKSEQRAACANRKVRFVVLIRLLRIWRAVPSTSAGVRESTG